MSSSADLFGVHRAFNWRRSVAISGTIAVHCLAFVLILAPVSTPHATERLTNTRVTIHVISPPPKPVTPPPMPEPPQEPPEVITQVEPPPILQATPQPVVVNEPSPVSVVAPPPVSLPTPPTVVAEVRPSADVTYRLKNPPVYPSIALRMGFEGRVLLQVLVATDGSVLQVRIGDSSGYRSLDRAALEAARKWKFHPGTHNGVAYQGWVIIPVNFEMRRL